MPSTPAQPLSIPPQHLLRKVGCTGDHEEYKRIGLISAHSIENFLGKMGHDWRRCSSWLDLACGCGRTLNFLRLEVPPSRLSGCDYDSSLIDWCRQNLPSIRFERNRDNPPLPFGDGSFEVIYSISFFTHLSEAAQSLWLREMKRVLDPQGLILLSLHGEALARRKAIRLPARGFRFQSVGPSFNEQVCYQTESFVRRQWGRDFEILAYEPLGLDNHQDLVLLAPAGKPPQAGPPLLPRVPEDLKEVWKRRPDLHQDFDSGGIGKPEGAWRNLSLIDWAILHGHKEMQELRKWGRVLNLNF